MPNPAPFAPPPWQLAYLSALKPGERGLVMVPCKEQPPAEAKSVCHDPTTDEWREGDSMVNVGASHYRKPNPYGYEPDKIVEHHDTGEVCGYVPTPDEIEAAAAEIRAEWSERRWAGQYGAPKPVEFLQAAKMTARKEKRRD